MSRDPVYDRLDYHGPTFKLLTEEETDRVLRKVKALQDHTLLRPDLLDVWKLCDGVILSLMSSRIDVAVVPPLKALFDEHGVA